MDREKNKKPEFELILQAPMLPDHKRAFVESLQTFYEMKGHLTPSQEKYWLGIKEEYSPEGLQKQELWRLNYDEEKIGAARICAEYYAATNKGGIQYFADIGTRVLEEEDFIPTEKQWRAMCANKYAKRVLEAALGEPRYAQGTLVQFRAARTPYSFRQKDLQNCALVIETNAAPVISAAKGAKRYKVLPVGGTTTYIVEERALKKYRKSKGKTP